MSDTYTCATCRETYNKGWTDEEAKKEKDDSFPEFEIEDCAMVCDDCYNKMFNVKEVK